MKSKNNIIIFIALVILVVLVLFISLFIGTNSVSFIDLIKTLFNSSDENALMIVKQIRMPRVIMACITGAALSVSGCVFQGILRNPLADPFTLGISGGAAFGAALGVVFTGLIASWFLVPLFAFAGSLVSVFAVYFLSSKKQFSSNSMILSGVVISYVFSSFVMLIFSLSKSHQIQAAFLWLMGSFSSFDERLLQIVIPVIIIGIVFILLNGNIINLIAVGGDKSKTLGVNTKKTTKILFLTASLITACAVSMCGVIGFVGLMMPHIMRKIVGANHITLIPASALAGAAFLPLCDTLSRVVFAPVIIPVGVITSIIGGAFFIFLFFKSKEGEIC